jgi:tetratricopeptide (TPR) repeat protein
MRSLLVCLTAIGLAVPFVVQAQIPEKFTNLQFFPEDIPRDTLVAKMRGITAALGIRCNYCHTGGTGQSLEGVDFASDDKVEKKKAREMMNIAKRINTELLANLPDRESPVVNVECVTCHRGLPIPRTLASELVNVATTKGADSAVAFYRKARTDHSDDGAYDLTERTVSQAAGTLVERGKTAEAIGLLEVNAELFPKSARALNQLAAAHEAAGHKDAAIEAYKKVLAVAPNDRQARARLTALGAPPPE